MLSLSKHGVGVQRANYGADAAAKKNLPVDCATTSSPQRTSPSTTR